MDDEWQVSQDAIDFETAWIAAQTGAGSPYFSLPVFVKFAEYVLSRGAIVDWTDVYEQTDEGLLPRSDLGMWGFPKGDLSWGEKFKLMNEELKLFVATLNAEGKPFSVECWVDPESDGS